MALGLGRLGRRVSLLSRVGDDARGERVRAHLAASGVSLVPGTITPGPTSTATAVLDARGVASYEFVLDWRLPATADVPEAKALHTGSIAAFLPPGGDAVLDLVRRAAGRLTVSFDPNARPALMGDAPAARRRVEAFVAAADVVKVSDEDLAWLAPGVGPLDVARAWLALGPAIVVVTRGPEGPSASARTGPWTCRRPPSSWWTPSVPATPSRRGCSTRSRPPISSAPTAPAPCAPSPATPSPPRPGARRASRRSPARARVPTPRRVPS